MYREMFFTILCRRDVNFHKVEELEQDENEQVECAEPEEEEEDNDKFCARHERKFGLGLPLVGRDFVTGDAQQIPNSDEFQEEAEEVIERTHSDENVQGQIDYINEVLASGEPWTSEEFPP